MYDDFAGVYDTLMDDYDYDAWSAYYLSLIDDMLEERPARMAECACGTGSLTVRFARSGLSVTGVDLSASMLRRAEEKARRWGVNAAFVRQDMKKLTLPRKVGAVLATCDGVNYLLTREDIKAFFECVFRSLKPSSPFAFDISNEEKLKKMGETYLYGEDREDSAYLWTNEYDENTRLINMNLTFFVEEADGRFSRFTESHTQRAHRVSEIKELLYEVGFTDVRVFGGDEGESEGPGGKRVYFLAKKP